MKLSDFGLETYHIEQEYFYLYILNVLSSFFEVLQLIFEGFVDTRIVYFDTQQFCVKLSL